MPLNVSIVVATGGNFVKDGDYFKPQAGFPHYSDLEKAASEQEMPEFHEIVQGKINESLERNGLKGWPADTCRFWQLDLELTDEMIEGAASELAKNLSVNRSVPARPAIAILMQVLRSYLPAVREMRLWPEVTDYFNGQSGLNLSSADYGNRFRQLLRQTFRERLDSIPNHNKYILVLLDEAGIGYDRSKIINQFLLDLTDLDISGFLSGNLGSIVDRALGRFIDKSHDRSDIDALRLVLLHAGNTLLKLRVALYHHDEPWEMALWDWEDLRQYWRDQSGEELGSIIPEARDIFSALLPHLYKSIVADKLFRLLAQNKYRVELLEQRLEPGDFKSADEIPLAEVLLSAGGISKSVLVTDSLGLTCHLGENYPKNKWQSIGRNGYFIWREDEFHVIKDGFIRQKSRPVVAPGSDKVTGYLWSGYLSHSQSVYVENPRLDLIRDPVVWLSFEWKYPDAGPVLSVKGVVLYNQPDLGETVFSINNEVIWSGKIFADSRFLPLKKEINTDANRALSGIRFNVSNDSGFFHQDEIRLPDIPFSIQQGRVYKPGTLCSEVIQKRSLDGIVLVGSHLANVPKAEKAKVREIPNFVSPAGTRAYRINVSDDTDPVLKVVWGEASWELAPEGAALSLSGPQQYEIDGAKIISTGNIQCAIDEELSSVVVEFSNLNQQNKYRIEIDCEGVHWGRQVESNVETVTISSLLSDMPGSIRASMIGLVKVQLTEDGITSGLPVYIFWVARAYEVSVDRLGNHSRLIFKNNAGNSLTITSDNTSSMASEAVSATLVFQAEDGLTSGDGVSVFWKSVCRDVFLITDRGPVDEGHIPLVSVEELNIEFIGDPHDWTLELVSESGTCLDKEPVIRFHEERILPEYIVTCLNSRETAADRNCTIIIKDDGNEVVHEYQLDLLSADVEMIVEKSEGAQDREVFCNISWAGLYTRDYELSVSAQGIADKKIIALEPAVGRLTKLISRTRLEFPELIALRPGTVVPVKLEFLVNGNVLNRITYDYSIEASVPDREQMKEHIRSILARDPRAENFSETDVEQVIFLIERYLVTFGELPYPPDRLEAGLSRLLESLQHGGELFTLFKTRRSLMEGPGIPHTRPAISRDATVLGLLANSLVAQVMFREHNLGTLDPEQASDLYSALNEQEELLEGVDLKRWANFLRFTLAKKFNLNVPDDGIENPRTEGDSNDYLFVIEE